MKFKVSIEEAIHQLAKEKQHRFTAVMKHGSMVAEYYAPQMKDLQTPHKQDELYIITSGTTVFDYNGEKANCKTGDVLFVPAGVKHHFENISDDFATWVIFYGPEGGETE